MHLLHWSWYLAHWPLSLGFAVFFALALLQVVEGLLIRRPFRHSAGWRNDWQAREAVGVLVCLAILTPVMLFAAWAAPGWPVTFGCLAIGGLAYFYTILGYESFHLRLFMHSLVLALGCHVVELMGLPFGWRPAVGIVALAIAILLGVSNLSKNHYAPA